jgi:2-oxoglutarate ferredoxin oxidoreductase subunit gamma
LVNPQEVAPGVHAYGIPATRIAEGPGRKMVLNMVVVGSFAAVTGLVDSDAVRQAVQVSVPDGSEELNLAVFERGFKERIAVRQS